MHVVFPCEKPNLKYKIHLYNVDEKWQKAPVPAEKKQPPKYDAAISLNGGNFTSAQSSVVRQDGLELAS